MTVLGNLIDNAVDAAQGSVGARVTVTAITDADGLVLRVVDTGAGVGPGPRGGGLPARLVDQAAGPGGRGLGLALVRQAVSRHDGTLTVTEAAGGGAEFEVRLPLPTAGRGRTKVHAGPESGSGAVDRVWGRVRRRSWARGIEPAPEPTPHGGTV